MDLHRRLKFLSQRNKIMRENRESALNQDTRNESQLTVTTPAQSGTRKRARSAVDQDSTESQMVGELHSQRTSGGSVEGTKERIALRSDTVEERVKWVSLQNGSPNHLLSQA